MKPYRSMLFVPGHKPPWAEKAIAAGADAIILDLEDSVPAADKAAARVAVRETIGRLHGQGVRADAWVRPNDYGSGLFGADAEALRGSLGSEGGWAGLLERFRASIATDAVEG